MLNGIVIKTNFYLYQMLYELFFITYRSPFRLCKKLPYFNQLESFSPIINAFRICNSSTVFKDDFENTMYMYVSFIFRKIKKILEIILRKSLFESKLKN